MDENGSSLSAAEITTFVYAQTCDQVVLPDFRTLVSPGRLLNFFFVDDFVAAAALNFTRLIVISVVAAGCRASLHLLVHFE